MPAYFLPIGAAANAIKGLSWMAGGSTKSVFKVGGWVGGGGVQEGTVARKGGGWVGGGAVKEWGS